MCSVKVEIRRLWTDKIVNSHQCIDHPVFFAASVYSDTWYHETTGVQIKFVAPNFDEIWSTFSSFSLLPLANGSTAARLRLYTLSGHGLQATYPPTFVISPPLFVYAKPDEPLILPCHVDAMPSPKWVSSFIFSYRHSTLTTQIPLNCFNNHQNFVRIHILRYEEIM